MKTSPFPEKTAYGLFISAHIGMSLSGIRNRTYRQLTIRAKVCRVEQAAGAAERSIGVESRAPKSAATGILLTRTRRLGVGALPQITFSLASLICTNILFCASVRADIADSRILGLISDVPGTSVRLIAASSAQAPKQLLRHPSLLYSPLAAFAKPPGGKPSTSSSLSLAVLPAHAGLGYPRQLFFPRCRC
ncbi:hypothetical protein VTI28DRAFT_2638 [Corynascus sepedonium]